MGMRGRRWLTLVLAGALVAAMPAAMATVVPDPPIKVQIPAPARGLPNPPDPPLVAGVDPAIATLAVPSSHPWMLFTPDELPALRQRILGADPASVVGRTWSRLLAAADKCCDGRTSTEEALSTFPDRSLGRDELAELGFVWHLTQDDRYLAKAKQLLAYVVATAPDYGTPIEPGVDEFYIQRAHRLAGLALAYDVLHPGLDEAERLQLRTAVTSLGLQHVGHGATAWWATISAGSNITGNNAAAIGVAGLALWHEDPTARLWVLRSDQLTRSFLAEGYDGAGAGNEGILYGNYGLRIPTHFASALLRAGGPDLYRTGSLKVQPEWFAYELLPGGGAVNPLNDARYYEINPTYLTWSTRHGANPALARWVWHEFQDKTPDGPRVGETLPTLLWFDDGTPQGYTPARDLPLARVFPGRGLVHTRSGWAAGDLAASFEARQIDWGEAVHLNQDVNHFTLYANGARLVVDSRYANWLSKVAAGDFEAAKTSESAAHNTVVVDGRSQDFHGTGTLRAFASAAVVGDPGPMDLAVGDARSANLVAQPARSERVFTHVRAGDGLPGYLLLADRVAQGDGADHTHTSYLHTEWENDLVVTHGDGDRIRARVDAPGGAGLDITVDVAGPATAIVGSFTPDDDQDWRTLPQPGRRAHDRLEVTATGGSYDAVTVLVPTATGRPAPPTTRLPAEGGIATRVGTGSTDLVLVATGDSPGAAADGFAVTGFMGLVRREAGTGLVTRFALAEGRALRDHTGKPLVRIDGAVGSVVADRTHVAVSGTGITGFRVVAAPGARVTLNGEPVRVTVDGDHLVWRR